MRPHFFLLVFLGVVLCLGTAHAQQQQPDPRIEQILKPKNQSFDLRQAKGIGSNSYNTTTNRVLEKKAPAPQKFDTKGFLTGKFTSEKSSFWMGDFKYNNVSDANTKSRYLFLMPWKLFSTKSTPVKTADVGTKKPFEGASVPTKDFRGRERDKLHSSLTPQQAAQNGYTGTLTELKTIDDVRALLNKNK